MHQPSDQSGIRTFVVIWTGQVISLIGSGMTSFALGLWVYDQTGRATQFALAALFSILPTLLLSPLAGVLVDRWDKRRVMILSDAGAGLVTFIIAWLLFTGHLQVWHIYVSVAANAVFATFQQPAYLAASSLLVTEKHYGRIGGMMQMGLAAADILSPAISGALMVSLGVSSVIFIDVATFLFAVSTLLVARAPALRQPQLTAEQKPSLLREMRTGWQYIAARSGLIGLLVFLAVSRFASGFIGALLIPMLRAFTTPSLTGLVITLAGSGMLVGSLLMSVWGGPRRKINGVLLFEMLKGLGILVMGLQPVVWLVALGASTAHFSISFANASNQAIWQAEVPTGLQGRVFAFREMVARSMLPIAYILAGPLADRVFEPLVQQAGLAASLVGGGVGRGMGLIFVAMGSAIILISIGGFFNPALRRVENHAEPLGHAHHPAAH